MSCKFTFC